MQFVFSDGGECWDNNHGQDFHVPVAPADYAARRSSSSSAVAGGSSTASSPAPPPRPPLTREIASRQSHPLAGGTLHLLELSKRATKAGRWQEEKLLRVWVPPGYDAANPPAGGYPVFFIADGQNLFEDWIAHQGVSWRAADAAAGLIACGAVKPFIIVGIDGSGVFRSLNYLPYPPGVGALGGFREECARWPGGGADAYVRRVLDDYVPLVESEFAWCACYCAAGAGGMWLASCCIVMIPCVRRRRGVCACC